MDDKSATLHTARVINTACNIPYLLISETNMIVLIIEKNARVRNSKAIVRPVALEQTLRDLSLHVLADAGKGLHRARQIQQSHHQLSSTHQLNPCHAAVALQPLNNHTARHIRQILVLILYRTPLHAPLAADTQSHSNAHNTDACPTSFPTATTPLQAPLTKSIFFRFLNRPRFTHNRLMSSSPLSCCSV